MLCELRLLVLFLVERLSFVMWFLPRLFFPDWFSEPLLSTINYIIENQLTKGSTERWTRVFGFKVQGANHYIIEPTPIIRMLTLRGLLLLVGFSSLFVMITVCSLFGFFLFFFHGVVSSRTRCVNSNLQHWSKGIEKMFYQDLVSGFWIQSSSC